MAPAEAWIWSSTENILSGAPQAVLVVQIVDLSGSRPISNSQQGETLESGVFVSSNNAVNIQYPDNP